MTSREEQVRAEAELAKQLAGADPEERQRLYGSVYDQIYEMHLSRSPETLEFGASLGLMPMLLKLTEPGQDVLEVGCGAGLLAVQLAREGRRVTGLEVSDVILDKARERGAGVEGLTLELVEGMAVPRPDASFDFAYSIEVLEHLHEADAVAHLREVRRVLKPGGRYWCLTPSALESVSATERFGVDVEVDADVHLKEWTYRELRGALREAGFGRAAVPLRDYRVGFPFVPLGLMAGLERVPALHRRPALMSRLGLVRCSIVASAPA